jgi:hypothetical protein
MPPQSSILQTDVDDAVPEDESIYTATAFVGGNGALRGQGDASECAENPSRRAPGVMVGVLLWPRAGLPTHSVYFTFSKDEHSYAETLCALTRQLFGLEATIQRAHRSAGASGCACTCTCKLLAQFVRGVPLTVSRLTSGAALVVLDGTAAVSESIPRRAPQGRWGDPRELHQDLPRQTPYWMLQIFLHLVAAGHRRFPPLGGSARNAHDNRGMWIHIGTLALTSRRLKAWLAGDCGVRVLLRCTASRDYFYKVLVSVELFVKVKECGWTAPHRLKVS